MPPLMPLMSCEQELVQLPIIFPTHPIQGMIESSRNRILLMSACSDVPIMPWTDQSLSHLFELHTGQLQQNHTAIIIRSPVLWPLVLLLFHSDGFVWAFDIFRTNALPSASFLTLQSSANDSGGFPWQSLNILEPSGEALEIQL